MKPVLEALGLVAEDRWTAAAEPVLWREQPKAWAMAIESDPRFAEAVRVARETMPGDIRDRIEALVRIDDDAIAAARQKRLKAEEQIRAQILGSSGRRLPDSALSCV